MWAEHVLLLLIHAIVHNNSGAIRAPLFPNHVVYIALHRNRKALQMAHFSLVTTTNTKTCANVRLRVNMYTKQQQQRSILVLKYKIDHAL